MLVKDKILIDIEKLLESWTEFQISSCFQINGISKYVNIQQNPFINSEYSFDVKSSNLLHFTSLNSCKLILETYYLKSSNFCGFTDPNELLHSINLGGINNFDVDEAKRYIFATCFTKLNKPLTLANYSFHWENYANNFKGVAIEFELSPVGSFQYALNVQYLNSSEQLDLLSKLKEKINDNTVIESLLPLLGSIKEPHFKDEEEIRIITNFSKDYILFNNQGSELDFYLDENNSVNYFGKLTFNSENKKIHESPLMKIKNIYLRSEAEINDGQRILLHYLMHKYEKEGIGFNFLD
jgi:hypothetical protein